MNTAKREIINVLMKLQKGYEEKNTENTSALMSEIFSDRQDLLVLGTGSSEICLGRSEVEKLIHDDWDGGWGDFKINIDGAKIEADGDVAWFYADCTVRYSFEDSDDKEYNRLGDWVKQITKSQNASPKQRLSFLNWALSLLYHQRKSGKREYLWPSELSGMLINENNKWKIASLHFAVAKPNYPDERLEETVDDYQEGHIHTRNKILAHNSNKANSGLLDFLKRLEGEIDDAKFGRLYFDPEQILMFDAGRFAWVIALGTTKQSVPEDEIFDKSLQEIGELFISDLSSEAKLFQAKRNIAYALREAASGAEFTWPVRLTAVIEQDEKGCILRHKHFSYPFYWIFEGKL